MVGSGVIFPKQKVQTIPLSQKTKKRVGALCVTCRGDKILVANIGEIAVRIVRTAHEMGIPGVAVYSTIDKDFHVKLADEAVCIGEAPSKQSYFVIPDVLSVAISRICTMLHPGYSFLVEMCREHGINFIGPNATPGEGGRGMRLAKEPEEFVKLLQSEAGATFGNDGVYLEKYVQNPRHIEFQVLADMFGNVVHFGERDCSIQGPWLCSELN